MKELLYKLLTAVTVGGFEESGQAVALDFARPWADEQRVDAVGSAFSVVNPEAPCRVLLVAHMDEIGFRVTHITDEGLLRVQETGGVRPKLYVGAPMQVLHERFENGKPVRSRVPGLGVVSKALLKQEKVEASDLLIDIGAADRAEAAAVVSVGDAVCADTQPRELLHGRFTSRALDDKAGCAVVLEAARLAKENGAGCGIQVMTSVGEETGARGAYFRGSQNSKPDCAIVVDVTWVSDCPGTDPGDTGSVKLGGGPVLCRSGMVNKRLNALLEQCATEAGIPVQYEVAGEGTYTDGDILLRSGIPMALVSVPLRYMHSSVEVAEWRDLEQCAALIAATVGRITPDFDFAPQIV